MSPWSLCVMRGSLSGPWGNGNVIKPFAKSYMITNPGPKSPFPPVPRTRILSASLKKPMSTATCIATCMFVLWLKSQPNAWRWYRIIQKAHPHTVPTIPTLWGECQKVWPLEREPNAGSRHHG